MRTMLRSLCILRFLSRVGRSVDEAFVQNGLFILQEAMGEPLDCTFYLDRRGPRSRDIFENLVSLEQEGKVTISGSLDGLVIEVTESGRRFVNQGGKWGAFFDLPPVRVPEDRIDTVFTLISSGTGIDMESMGIALFFALTSEGPESLLDDLKAARGEGRLAAGIGDRAVIEAYRRLKKFGLRSVR